MKPEFKEKYNLMAEVDMRTKDFCRDDNGNLENYLDVWIQCQGKCKIFHYGASTLEFYCPSLGRGRNILKDIFTYEFGTLDKFISKRESTTKTGEVKESIIFDYDSFYEEFKKSKLIFDIEETDEEVLFKFKAKNLETLEPYVKPKTNHAGRSPYSIKNLREQLGIKKSQKIEEIPSNEINKYKEITSVIDKGNISVYNNINDGFLAVLSAKNNSDIDTFKAKIKESGMTFKGHMFSLGEETWNEYLEYTKNYLKENL